MINKLKSLRENFFDEEIAETEHVFFLREQDVDDSDDGILELPGLVVEEVGPRGALCSKNITYGMSGKIP